MLQNVPEHFVSNQEPTHCSCCVAVTLKDSGIMRPKELDGKKYASYGARYEGRIVQVSWWISRLGS